MKVNNTYFALASAQLFPFQALNATYSTDDEAVAVALEGYKLVEDKKFAEAIIFYTEAIANYTEQPFFYACRSMLHRVMGDEESAFYDYQVAKRLDFNYHNYLEWSENAGAMEEANELTELHRSLEKDDQNAQLYINRALLQVQHFNYEEAVADYSRAYDLQANAVVLVSRAAVYLRLLRYDLALKDLDTAIAMDSSLVAAYTTRAKLFTAIRDYDWAKVDYEKAIALQPQDESIFEERAQFFEQQEDWDSAIADYSVLIRRHADDFYGYVMRADLYEKIGRFDLAIADYDQAIALNPYYSDLYQYRAELKEKTGDQAGAEADYAKFEELEEE